MRQLLQAARRNPDAANAIIVTVLAAVLFTVMAVTDGRTAGEEYDLRAYLLLAGSVTPLLLRWHYPRAVLIVVMTAHVSWYLLGYTGILISFPVLVAIYTVGLTGNRRCTIITGTVIAAVIVATVVVTGEGGAHLVIVAIGWTLAALLMGEALRTNRALVADFEQQAAQAELERELHLERRLAAERVRIAQELHDLMAHTITTMTVQAGLAADALDDDPEIARQSLQTIRAAGKEATREVKATVALLRQDGDRARRTPMPGLAQMSRLVERATAAGLHVDVTEVGERRPLPAVIELTAYRVVQEALTNVARHASTGCAAVELQYEDDALVVEVTNEGPALANGRGRGSGYGLLGMAERAAAIGGTVVHGSRPGGGYRVWAKLPIESRAFQSEHT